VLLPKKFSSELSIRVIQRLSGERSPAFSSNSMSNLSAPKTVRSAVVTAVPGGAVSETIHS